MNTFKWLFAASILFFPSREAKAQAIENNSLARHIASESYFRIRYENDFFAATDYYYTQGFLLEYVDPGMVHFPLMRLPYQPSNSSLQFGIAIEDNAYTPTNYVAQNVLLDDRPFAGLIFLKTFVIAMDNDRKRRIVSSLNTGVIGPAAGGKEMQTYIHEKTGNALPLGWHNQIKNDLVLNYDISFSQLILQTKVLNVAVQASAKAGTLSDKATLGMHLVTGLFDQPWNEISPRKFQIYMFAQPQVSVVGYDATMQGGVFNHSSPRTINNSDINRITGNVQTGIIIKIGKAFVEYNLQRSTREFRYGRPHNTGGLQFGCSF